MNLVSGLISHFCKGLSAFPSTFSWRDYSSSILYSWLPHCKLIGPSLLFSPPRGRIKILMVNFYLSSPVAGSFLVQVIHQVPHSQSYPKGQSSSRRPGMEASQFDWHRKAHFAFLPRRFRESQSLHSLPCDLKFFSVLFFCIKILFFLYLHFFCILNFFVFLFLCILRISSCIFPNYCCYR